MSRLAYARLSDSLLGGPMPFTERHVRALSDEGVTAVINLCEDGEYWEGERDLVSAQYRQAGISEHRLTVKDGATVPADVLDRAVTLAAAGGTLYVHCRGGRERSATVCAAIVTRREDVPPADAIRLTQVANPVFKPLPWQVEGLEQWARSSGSGPG
jgi:protein tyrosine phosphatase (PTP) superfamily phosphohydrolase (DUF442 family)